MTTLSDTILSIVILLLPVLMPIGMGILSLFEQRLPSKQHAALDQFAKYAVQKVEQQHTHNPQKKALAVRFVANCFKDADIPVPADSLIDSAIESFVYELGGLQAPKQPEPAAISTGPLPVPPVAPTQSPQA